jgi:nitrate reductase gamma subunit
MFTEADLTDIYGYLWYVHAIFTGAFVAFLPFSRMFHMVMAPVSLAINAAAKQHR